LAGAVALAMVFTAFIDTGSFADWLSAHQAAKTDEVVVITFVLACGAGIFAIRRWLGVSYRLIRFEASHEPSYLADATQVQRSLRRDLVGFGVVLGIAVLLLPVIDTGPIASWIASRSQTKVDEALVITFVVMVGLTFFGVRRWMELTRQLVKAESLHRSSARLDREMAILNDLGDLLQSCRASAEAQQLIANRAALLFPGSSGAVCALRPADGALDVVATWGRPPFADAVFSSDECWALRRGRTHAMAGDASVVCAHVGLPKPSRSLCVPMVAHGQTRALLYLCEPAADEAVAWSEDEERLAKTIADQGALALANLTLGEDLRRQAIRDELTGLYNRPFFEETLARELCRSAEYVTPLALLLVDVDHFRTLNDRLGSEAGDALLRTIADLLRSAFTGEDVVCRWGGEEFAMLLPDTPRQAAEARAEAVRAAMEKMVVMVRGPVPARATLSLGLASFPEDGSNAAAIVHAADAALYRAKANGRNQVATA
jgi:diguanylate cyclase (GGDEF)-like protein